MPNIEEDFTVKYKNLLDAFYGATQTRRFFYVWKQARIFKMGKKEYLYCLQYIKDDKPIIFYVGKTKNIERRLKQHQKAWKTGHEDKYVFIQELEDRNIGWGIEILKEIPADKYPMDYEHFYVIKFFKEGHPLKNMKHGDLEKTFLNDLGDDWKSIRSVNDVTTHRLKVEKTKNIVKNHKSTRLKYKTLLLEVENLRKKTQSQIWKLKKFKEHTHNDLGNFLIKTGMTPKKADLLYPEYKEMLVKIKEAMNGVENIKEISNRNLELLDDERINILFDFFTQNISYISESRVAKIKAAIDSNRWEDVESMLMLMLNKNYKTWDKVLGNFKCRRTIVWRHKLIEKIKGLRVEVSPLIITKENC